MLGIFILVILEHKAQAPHLKARMVLELFGCLRMKVSEPTAMSNNDHVERLLARNSAASLCTAQQALNREDRPGGHGTVL